MLTLEQIQKIKEKEPKENDIISKLLENKEREIINFLSEHNMFNIQLKDELFKSINKIYSEKGNNPKEFFEQLKLEGIYCRQVYKNKIPYLIYGIKHANFYIQDKKLSKKFTYSHIMGIKNEKLKSVNTKEFSIDQQKSFLKNMANKVLNKSNSLIEFDNLLKANGIQLITYENKRGMYGISFKASEIYNPAIIKGSDINLSFSTIQNHFSMLDNNEISFTTSLSNTDKEYDPVQEYQPALPALPTNLKSRNSEEEDDRIRKGKRKNKGFSM